MSNSRKPSGPGDFAPDSRFCSTAIARRHDRPPSEGKLPLRAFSDTSTYSRAVRAGSHSSSLQLISPSASRQQNSVMNRGLDAAAATALASITPQNQQRRSQLAQELSVFLQQLPWQSDLQTCTPEELLVYLQLEYLPKHAGSRLPDGAVIAAPSTIATIISHLRMIFKTVGRGDIWEAEEAHGNPACSHQIKQWQQGGGKQSSKAGWRSTGAVPMTETKMIQLLQHIQQAGHAQPRQISL